MAKKKQGRERVYRRGLSFDQWILYVFDHDVPSGNRLAWYHQMNASWWSPSLQPQVTVAYLTTVFENATRVLMPFSDAQINQGFWFLLDRSCSEHMVVLSDWRVPWLERKRCISSMYVLFAQFFALRCTPHLSHLDTLEVDISKVSPLNSSCYMWWDLLPSMGKEVGEVCLEVMQRTLDLDAITCRESALHGLGHWVYDYPQEVETIIGAWLIRNPFLKETLKEYAHAAQKGRVL